MATPSIRPARWPTRPRADRSPIRLCEILAQIDALLAEAGSAKANILSATIYLSDIATFAEMNGVWDEWVDKANPPARATVEAKLVSPAYKVEIAVIAAL